MICPFCLQEHPAGANFCPVTGEALTAVIPADRVINLNCPTCGRVVESGWSTCANCGSALRRRPTFLSPILLTQRKRSSKGILLAVTGFVLSCIVLLGSAGMFVLSRQAGTSGRTARAIVPVDAAISGTVAPVQGSTGVSSFLATDPTPEIVAASQDAPVVVSITVSPTPTPLPIESPAPSPTATVTATVGPVLNHRPVYVLWDTSHGPRESNDGGPYDPTGIYSPLAAYLADDDIFVDTTTQPVTNIDLSGYQALVINELSAWRSNYSQAEAAAIVHYVENGGSLLILSEKSGFPNHVAPVANAFGVQVSLDPPITTVQSFTEHPLMRGIGQLEFLFDGGGLQADNSAAVPVASAGGNHAVIVLENLSGRVVVIGDTNLFDHRGLLHADNRAFAGNLFRWLTFLE